MFYYLDGIFIESYLFTVEYDYKYNVSLYVLTLISSTPLVLGLIYDNLIRG